jgi:hypothetical protein
MISYLHILPDVGEDHFEKNSELRSAYFISLLCSGFRDTWCVALERDFPATVGAAVPKG